MKTFFQGGRRAALMASGCALALVSGCAEVTFKRGAGPGEMQATEQGCRAKSTDVEAYKACLNAAGFIYAKPSGDAVLFAEDGEAGADGIAVGSVADASPSPSAATASSGPTTDTPTVSVQPSGRAGESLPQAAKPTAAPADPLKKVTVASWWKLGGTAGGLEADQASCGATLGDAHAVAPNAKVMTIGMLRCLKGKGWFAVGR